MIKIDFEVDTKYGRYRDALYLPEDHGMSDEQISTLQQERVSNWLYAIENPPSVEPETVEIDGVLYEKVEVSGQVMLKPVGV